MKLLKLKLIATASALMAMAQVSNASIIVYTDRAAWESDISGTITEENFNGVTKYDFSFGTNNVGNFDIEISGESTGSNRIEDITNYILDIDGSNYYLGNVRKGSPTTQSRLLFGTNINAFSADWVGTIGFGNLVANVAGININFSDYFTGSGVGAGTGFLGLISTSAFDHISLSTESTSANEAFGMDNVAFSTFSIPEPNSLALILVPFAAVVMRNVSLKN